ncbi:hypothetical protein BDR04DRAFT_1117059 [Suillus decipiens]|nr:hypothetical protein BDR04DRAFT_1117059 [Suillus decipiens]
MAALGEMYMHPDRLATFFQVVCELPSLQKANVLVMDPKNKVPKLMTDKMGVRWMKTLNDLGPIDVAFTSNFEVPHAQFIFPVPSNDAQLHISYFMMMRHSLHLTLEIGIWACLFGCIWSNWSQYRIITTSDQQWSNTARVISSKYGTHSSTASLSWSLTSVPKVAAAQRAPGPIRRLMSFCADFCTRAVQQLKSLIRRGMNLLQ